MSGVTVEHTPTTEAELRLEIARLQAVVARYQRLFALVRQGLAALNHATAPTE